MQTSASTQQPESPSDDASAPSPAGKSWPMTLINFWLDAILFLAIVVVIWVAVILQIAFPRPSAAVGWSLWGLTYDEWHNVQFGALCVAGALTVEHLVLHWNWVCTVLSTRILHRQRPDEANQVVYGVATFVGILLLVQASLIAAMFCIKQP